MNLEREIVIVIDPDDATRELVCRRLSAQGYQVESTRSAAEGAEMALRNPPAALVANLWMPSISGVQLCRLLRSEPATADVPIVLCGDVAEPRNRFWAERAGASGFVARHRTGDLVRALARAITAAPRGESFFFQLGDGAIDVRERIARHLDDALFESVIASEVRALAACGDFERLFDLLAQFVSQVSRYRWLAVSAHAPARIGIHHPPHARDSIEAEVTQLGGRFSEGHPDSWFRIEDEDALPAAGASSPIVQDVRLGSRTIAQIALSPVSDADADAADKLLCTIARELGTPLRMTELVEEAQRLASTDMLTKISNRRSFTAALTSELARSQRHSYPLCVAMLDVDHFKKINDTRGHAAGDRVLAAIGAVLSGAALRQTDLRARWGGEEFVAAFLSTGASGALVAAERLREAIASLAVIDDQGATIAVTASIGIAELVPHETLEQLMSRADEAMYEAKASGRNRVVLANAPPSPVRSVA